MTIHNFLGDGPNGMNSGSHVALKQGCRVQLKPKIDVVHLGDQGEEGGEICELGVAQGRAHVVEWDVN